MDFFDRLKDIFDMPGGKKSRRRAQTKSTSARRKVPARFRKTHGQRPRRKHTTYKIMHAAKRRKR